LKETLIKEREILKQKHQEELDTVYKKYTDLVQLTTFYETEIQELKNNEHEKLKHIKSLEQKIQALEAAHKQQLSAI
jgi:hypothetical protein